MRTKPRTSTSSRFKWARFSRSRPRMRAGTAAPTARTNTVASRATFASHSSERAHRCSIDRVLAAPNVHNTYCRNTSRPHTSVARSLFRLSAESDPIVPPPTLSLSLSLSLSTSYLICDGAVVLLPPSACPPYPTLPPSTPHSPPSDSCIKLPSS